MKRVRLRIAVGRLAGLLLLLTGSAPPAVAQDIAADLLARWQLDETSGTTAVDSSGSGRHGLYQNSPALGEPGAVNEAVRFNGTTQRVVVADHPSFSNHVGSGLTVAAWVRVHAFHTDSHHQTRQPIVAKGINGAWEWALYVYDNGRAGFSSWQQSGSSHNEVSGGQLIAGQWTHVAATYVDGVANRVYVNGQQVVQKTSFSGAAYDGDRPVLIAAREDGQFLNADVDEVRIYARALTSQDMLALYEEAFAPVGHWKLDETSGSTAVDASNSGHDGVYTNSPALGVDGIRNTAVEFDGGNYVLVADDPELDMNNYVTMAAWIKPSTSSAIQHIINKEGEYEIAVFPGGTIRWALANTNPGWAWHNTGHVVPYGRWSHVALTYNRGEVVTYVDGKVVEVYNGSGPIGDAHTSRNTLQIAARENYTNLRFVGPIDDVYLYNRAISPAEVAELYGLVGHWKFDEGAGATAADSSGVGADASLINSAAWTSDCHGNNALETDGAGGVARTDADFDPPSTGTVAFWMRASGRLAARERLFGINGNWEARIETSGTISFDLGGSPYVGHEPFATASNLDKLDRWYHVVALFDADDDSFAVYVNGELESSGVSPVNLVAQNPGILSFGTRTGNSEYWQGALRDFRVYNRKITVEEIARLSGLVGHWRFDETIGSVAYDSTGNGNDGAYVGGPLLGVDSRNPAKLGTAVEFDGNDDYVEIPHSDLMLADEGGVTFWFRANSSAGRQGLFTKDSSGFDSGGHLTIWLLNNTLEARMQSRTKNYYVQSSDVAAGKWTHAALTWGLAGMKLYVNGVEVDANLAYSGGMGSTSGGAGNFEPIAVAANAGNSGNGVVTPLVQHFDGAVDDLQFFARPLCAEEIYGSYVDGRGAGLRIKRWVETR